MWPCFRPGFIQMMGLCHQIWGHHVTRYGLPGVKINVFLPPKSAHSFCSYGWREWEMCAHPDVYTLKLDFYLIQGGLGFRVMVQLPVLLLSTSTTIEGDTAVLPASALEVDHVLRNHPVWGILRAETNTSFCSFSLFTRLTLINRLIAQKASTGDLVAAAFASFVLPYMKPQRIHKLPNPREDSSPHAV